MTSKTLIIHKNRSSCISSRIWEHIEGYISIDSRTFVYAHSFQLSKCLQTKETHDFQGDSVQRNPVMEKRCGVAGVA